MSVKCPACGSQAIRRGATSRPGRHRYQCTKRGCPTNYFTSGGEQNGPNVLSIDIETLPLKAYTWGTWNQNVHRSQLISDWSLLSYSAKWIGDDRVISGVLTPSETALRNDKRIAHEIWRLLDRADIVIGHNNRRFDLKKINARFWKHGFHPPSSYKTIDTLAAAKSAFGLTYNSMDFIAEYKETDQKLDTNFELWAKADAGDLEALEYMRQYNEQDILTQEKIYLLMREWIPGHPNLTLYHGHQDSCPVCLSNRIKPIGYYYTNKKKYKEYRCHNCGSVWHDSRAEKRG